ncbi:hypothetical protein [Tissierella sp.]|uniref:hypothetical protein n=1 Tax=Tissierella sp. TaxID=41274 RepID=UPI002862FBCB|nr:hypothetical protein [Tissierella sp.]MDR7857557.1 hypothetical protein [Tissierella sp.]
MKNKILIPLMIIAILLSVGLAKDHRGLQTVHATNVGNDLRIVPPISGTIEALNFKESTLTILDYQGKTHIIRVNQQTKLEIEGLKKTLTDFYFGQEVDVNYEGTLATKITGYEEEDPDRDGYIMAGSRFKRGEVLFITNNSLELKTNQGREKYRITPNTIYLKRNRTININQIKEGDKVLLTFNSIYTSEVAEIRIEDEEQIISGVLRGKIELVDDRNKEIIIKTPYIYNEGKWSPHNQYLVSLKASGDTIYNGSEKISLQKLKYFKGKEVYIAYDNSYSRMQVAKLTVKNGQAQGYQAKVSNIQYTTGTMVVDKNLMHFNEGTIVLKDNRIVDTLNIDKNKDVIVTVDNIYGTKNTSLISMTANLLEDRIDNTKISIYRGKIEDIYDYEIEIGKINYRLDYLLLEDQKWQEKEDSQRFSMSEDTLIYDSDLKETIDASYFISSRFTNLTDIKNQALRNRLKNNYYKNKQAYFIVRESEYGAELLALNLTPHKQSYAQNVKLNHSVQGEIKSIDYDRGTITLTKVKNYNTLNNRWENIADETMDIRKSVILLNDLPLPIDKIYNLRVGAKVYAVKEKVSSLDEGYVLLIED